MSIAQVPLPEQTHSLREVYVAGLRRTNRPETKRQINAINRENRLRDQIATWLGIILFGCVIASMICLGIWSAWSIAASFCTWDLKEILNGFSANQLP